jgi:hypothetical protein
MEKEWTTGVIPLLSAFAAIFLLSVFEATPVGATSFRDEGGSPAELHPIATAVQPTATMQPTFRLTII